jgi:Ca2+-binding RTX toxin-like protein
MLNFSGRTLIATTAAAAAMLGGGAAGAGAATVDNLGPLITYDAGFNEVNTVTLETDGAFGSPDFALKFTDLAGLSGCDTVPNSAARRCVLAPTFVELAVDLGARNDTFKVDADPLGLVSVIYDVRGRIGDDHLFGGPERSILSGDDGVDAVFGEAGEDSLFGGGGRDQIGGGRDDDGLFGGTHDDTLHGDAGNDLVEGQDGGDTMFGDAGRDTLRGGGGADRIFAQDGERDTISCGPGNDEAEVDAFLDSISPDCEDVTH